MPIFNSKLFFCLFWKMVFHHPHFYLENILAAFWDNCIMHNFSRVWNIFHSGITQEPNDGKKQDEINRDLCKARLTFWHLQCPRKKSFIQFSNRSYKNQHATYIYFGLELFYLCSENVVMFLSRLHLSNNCANNPLGKSSIDFWIR